MESDSKSNQEWHLTEHSSGMSILVLLNTDWESRTTTQETTDNGGCSTGDQEPSDLLLTETKLSPLDTLLETSTTMDTMQLFNHSDQTTTTREW